MTRPKNSCEGDNCKCGMDFILTWKYLENKDNRSHNICVSSDKLWFFCLSAIFSFFESHALFQ